MMNDGKPPKCYRAGFENIGAQLVRRSANLLITPTLHLESISPGAEINRCASVAINVHLCASIGVQQEKGSPL